MNVSQMYWLKIKRHGFADERAVITRTLISSCDWKIHVPFWLRKKRPEKAFSTLTVNYRKIIQKKTNYAIRINSKLAIY